DADARVVLNAERVKYWLSVGAKPSDKVGVLIKKYGPEGTHAKQAEAARAKLKLPKPVPPAPKPVELPKPVAVAAAAEGSEGAPAAEAASEG
ncbi:MAG TPA: 30S ribosomal protein S16, partial [Pirellulales bacterium]